jgi:hypothetical protein
MPDELKHNADHHHDHDHSHDGKEGHNGDHHHHHEHDYDHHGHGSGGEQDHAARGADGSGKSGDLTKTTALLDYMLDHNKHHAEELTEMAKDLRGAGLEKEAALVDDAVKALEEGAGHLAKAVESIKKGK